MPPRKDPQFIIERTGHPPRLPAIFTTQNTARPAAKAPLAEQRPGAIARQAQLSFAEVKQDNSESMTFTQKMSSDKASADLKAMAGPDGKPVEMKLPTPVFQTVQVPKNGQALAPKPPVHD